LSFDAQRRADPSKRLIAAELADKLGLDREAYEVNEDTTGPAEARAARFLQQLAEHQSPDVVRAVQEVLEGWRALGGGVDFGRAAETSAILYLLPFRHRGYVLWVSVIYPSGSMEISFQHLKVKEPFTDPTLRDEFRLHINEAPNIDIPESKLGLRPSLPITILATRADRSALLDAYAWFVQAARGALDTQQDGEREAE